MPSRLLVIALTLGSVALALRCGVTVVLDRRERAEHDEQVYATAYLRSGVSVDSVDLALGRACEEYQSHWQAELRANHSRPLRTYVGQYRIPNPDTAGCRILPRCESDRPGLTYWAIRASASHPDEGISHEVRSTFRFVVVAHHRLPRRPVLYLTDRGLPPSFGFSAVQDESRALAEFILRSLKAQNVVAEAYYPKASLD